MRWLSGGNPLLLLGREEVVARFVRRMSPASPEDCTRHGLLWAPDHILPGALLVDLASVGCAGKVFAMARCWI